MCRQCVIERIGSAAPFSKPYRASHFATRIVFIPTLALHQSSRLKYKLQTHLVYSQAFQPPPCFMWRALGKAAPYRGRAAPFGRMVSIVVYRFTIHQGDRFCPRAEAYHPCRFRVKVAHSSLFNSPFLAILDFFIDGFVLIIGFHTVCFF